MKWKQSRAIPLELWLPALGLGLLLLFLGLLAPQQEAPPRILHGHDGWRNAPSLHNLRLEISPQNLWRLRLKRERALTLGILVSAADDWVAATLHDGAATWPVKLRLKGDWTDHLERGKWSFRIKVRDGGAYHGLSVFSLHSPHARSFLKEWLFHQALRDADVLTTRYDFVRLALNGADLGVYALEEHFTKELLESQGRREGPLLKFSEDGLWAARIAALKDTLFPYMTLPVFQAAQAEPFQSAKLVANPALEGSVPHALSLMHQYKHGLAPPAELFDLDAVARQYALTDLFHGHHSLIWHNRRFYYNSFINKLEPVVYDAFAGGQDGQYLNGPFAGYGCNGQTSYGFAEDLLGTRYFAEDEFVRAYYGYLFAWSQPDSVAAIFQKYGADLAAREHFLRREFLNYRFGDGDLATHAEVIRTALGSFDPASLEFEWGGDSTLCVRNYARLALEVDALRNAMGEVLRFAEPVLLGANDRKFAPVAEFSSAVKGAILLRVAGSPLDGAIWVEFAR